MAEISGQIPFTGSGSSEPNALPAGRANSPTAHSTVSDLVNEMQNAASARTSIPASRPANARPETINRLNSNISNQESRGNKSKKLSLQSLLTTPAKLPPSSPFGIGEMIQASRVDITSVDTHAELYSDNFEIKAINRPIRGKKVASKLYQQQSDVEPIRLEKDETRKKDPDKLRRLEAVKQLSSLINTQKLSITQSPKLQNRASSAQTVKASSLVSPVVSKAKAFEPERTKAEPKISAAAKEESNRLREDIMPYALKYARALGYSPDIGETEKILEKTISFYSKNEKLANTLKNLASKLS